MRYEREKSADWVEIKGAAQLPIKRLKELYAGDVATIQARVSSLVVDCYFEGEDGQPADPRQDYEALTVGQWDWLREKCLSAARDERVDPLP